VNGSDTGARWRALAAGAAVSAVLAACVAKVWLSQLAWAQQNERAFVAASALAGVGLILRTAQAPGLAAELASTAALATIALLWLPSGSALAALGVALVLGLAAALHALALRWTRDSGRAARATLALLALMTTAPLWAAPAAERASRVAADAIVALSPLSLLAVLAGHDYLRAPWWYAHSAFGALRFAYPSAGALIASYLCASVLCYAASRASLHTQRSTSP
jgi:hypothetical protein